MSLLCKSRKMSTSRLCQSPVPCDVHQTKTKFVLPTQQLCSIHFLNSRATSTTAWSIAKIPTGHATLGHPTTACSLVDLHHDWIHNTLKLLLLRLELIFFSHLILVKP